MTDPGPRSNRRATARQDTARRALTIAVILLTLWVTRSFLIPLAWAAVLAITAWPLYRRMSPLAGRQKWAPPAAVTLLVAVVLMIPLSVIAMEAARDSHYALTWLGEAQRHGIKQPGWIAHIPLIGSHAASWWQHYAGSAQAANALIARLNAGSVFSVTGTIGAQVAHGLMLFLVTLIALYAMLRHGERLEADARGAATRWLGAFGTRFSERLVSAVRGTVAGTVLVAIGEGALIGVGYAVAGVPRPFLFAILTMAFAMLPFGAWVMFTIAALVLLAQGSVVAAIALFAFSTCVMLVGDNFVQPALIGNAVRLPFLLALVGTLGGLEAFGLVGLFLGPVTMAVLLLIWRESIDRPSRQEKNGAAGED